MECLVATIPCTVTVALFEQASGLRLFLFKLFMESVVLNLWGLSEGIFASLQQQLDDMLVEGSPRT